MTDQNAQQQEPSMEEILASIRRIISEDGEDGERPQEKPAEVAATLSAAEPEADVAANSDVLELTEVVEEAAPAMAPPPRRSLDEAARPRLTPRLVEEPPLDVEEAALVSETVASRTQASVAKLVAAMGAAGPLGGRYATLADIVKTLLRPLLKEWLDKHLAGIVDEIVREEIERVVGRRHRR
ncbi:MAG: DUF2497 domain-containing protein [Alphaproteobacteria bacterium]|nr:DUF2497 domain-containing protein [Alphaproteobacteria bacterium]